MASAVKAADVTVDPQKRKSLFDNAVILMNAGRWAMMPACDSFRDSSWRGSWVGCHLVVVRGHRLQVIP